MIDRLEKMSVQDLGYAKAFGISEKEVEKVSLHQMKNEMHYKAFNMRKNKETITQEEANILNKKLNEIIQALEEEHNYDGMSDYWIDFDSFVQTNVYYNKFAW